MKLARVPNIGDALAEEIDAEVLRSEKHGKEFASLHEAYAVILEEVDELWDLTRLKKRDRSLFDIHSELIQIAAMAIKADHSLHNFFGGNV